MIKQAVLFVASTGLLIYFIMPVDDDAQKQAVVQETSKQKSNNRASPSNSWDTNYDDQEEDFVFGQPLVYSENDEQSAENNGEYEGEQPSAAGEVTKSVVRRNYVSPAIYSQAPKPGAPGSKGNPIDMSPPGGRQQR